MGSHHHPEGFRPAASTVAETATEDEMGKAKRIGQQTGKIASAPVSLAERDVALSQELNTAMELLRLGLGALQKIDGANDFYHLPLHLLASGKERLLKVMLCLHAKNQTGAYPTKEELKKLSHDIVRLLDDVIDPEVFGRQWIASTAAGKDDHKFLKKDPRYRSMVTILSHFGVHGRYSDLDVIGGSPQAVDSPQLQWTRFEMKLLPSTNLSQLATPEGAREARTIINKKAIVSMEYSLRALARWFTLGGGAPNGRIYLAFIKDFLFLMDADFGTRSY